MNVTETMSIQDMKTKVYRSVMAANIEFARHRHYESLEGPRLRKRFDSAETTDEDSTLAFARGYGDNAQFMHFTITANTGMLSRGNRPDECVEELYIPTASPELLRRFFHTALTDYYNR